MVYCFSCLGPGPVVQLHYCYACINMQLSGQTAQNDLVSYYSTPFWPRVYLSGTLKTTKPLHNPTNIPVSYPDCQNDSAFPLTPVSEFCALTGPDVVVQNQLVGWCKNTAVSKSSLILCRGNRSVITTKQRRLVHLMPQNRQLLYFR